MKKIFVLLLLSSLFFGGYVFAQNFGGTRLQSVVAGTGLKYSLEGSIVVVVSSILGLLGTIFLVLTIYAGILWMTASGEEAKIEKAKEIIKAAVIGLAIVMSAYTITFFVGNKLKGATPNIDKCIGFCTTAGNCDISKDGDSWNAGSGGCEGTVTEGGNQVDNGCCILN